MRCSSPPRSGFGAASEPISAIIYDVITVVLAMILPIEALRNALVSAFGQIVQNLNAIP